MTLLAEIGQQDCFDQQLKVFGEGLADVLEVIEGASGKLRLEGKSQKESTLHPLSCDNYARLVGSPLHGCQAPV